MWSYKQSTGELFRDGKLVGSGYSGHDWGKNNPNAEKAQGIGPIPEGLWNIGSPYDSQNTGPFTLILSPKPGTNVYGRSGFRIHGDSIANPGTASHGCIILNRALRNLIWNSGDKTLKVIE